MLLLKRKRECVREREKKKGVGGEDRVNFVVVGFQKAGGRA